MSCNNMIVFLLLVLLNQICIYPQYICFISCHGRTVTEQMLNVCSKDFKCCQSCPDKLGVISI